MFYENSEYYVDERELDSITRPPLIDKQLKMERKRIEKRVCNEYCYNNGTCSVIWHTSSGTDIYDVACMCRNGYSGEKCEHYFNLEHVYASRVREPQQSNCLLLFAFIAFLVTALLLMLISFIGVKKFGYGGRKDSPSTRGTSALTENGLNRANGLRELPTELRLFLFEDDEERTHGKQQHERKPKVRFMSKSFTISGHLSPHSPSPLAATHHPLYLSSIAPPTVRPSIESGDELSPIYRRQSSGEDSPALESNTRRILPRFDDLPPLNANLRSPESNS